MFVKRFLNPYCLNVPPNVYFSKNKIKKILIFTSSFFRIEVVVFSYAVVLSNVNNSEAFEVIEFWVEVMIEVGIISNNVNLELFASTLRIFEEVA